MRYRGSSVSYDNARYLMRQELGAADFAPPPSPPDGSGRRRIAATMSAMPTGGAPGFVVGAAMGFGRHLLRSLTVAPYRLIDSPTALTSAARAAAASAAFASRDAGAAASAAEGGARPRSLQQQQSQRLYAGAEADLYEAYTNVAVAAAIALVSSGTIAFVYGWWAPPPPPPPPRARTAAPSCSAARCDSVHCRVWHLPLAASSTASAPSPA